MSLCKGQQICCCDFSDAPYHLIYDKKKSQKNDTNYIYKKCHTYLNSMLKCLISLKLIKKIYIF